MSEAWEAAPPEPSERGVQRGLADLRRRLMELQRNVELLGSEDPATIAPTPPLPAVRPPIDAPPDRAAAPATSPDRRRPPPAVDREAPLEPRPQPPSTRASEAAIEPLERAGPTVVANLNAGPFADLIELRRFEEDLAALAAVREVRVRRFGRGRASIEIGLAVPYLLARELQQLGWPLEVAQQAGSEMRIELVAPSPDAPPASGGS